jgi:hypothetical protein
MASLAGAAVQEMAQPLPAKVDQVDATVSARALRVSHRKLRAAILWRFAALLCARRMNHNGRSVGAGTRLLRASSAGPARSVVQ